MSLIFANRKLHSQYVIVSTPGYIVFYSLWFFVLCVQWLAGVQRERADLKKSEMERVVQDGKEEIRRSSAAIARYNAEMAELAGQRITALNQGEPLCVNCHARRGRGGSCMSAGRSPGKGGVVHACQQGDQLGKGGVVHACQQGDHLWSRSHTIVICY